MFPKSDVKLLKTQQISAECLAKYITLEFLEALNLNNEKLKDDINLKKVTVKVYEDKGKCGIYNLKF